MNDAMRRITGITGPALPRQRCMDWHGYSLCPCKGCLVAPLFEADGDGEAKKTLANPTTAQIAARAKCRNRVFLSPFRNRPGRLFYLDVWVQPISVRTATSYALKTASLWQSWRRSRN